MKGGMKGGTRVDVDLLVEAAMKVGSVEGVGMNQLSLSIFSSFGTMILLNTVFLSSSLLELNEIVDVDS